MLSCHNTHGVAADEPGLAYYLLLMYKRMYNTMHLIMPGHVNELAHQYGIHIAAFPAVSGVSRHIHAVNLKAAGQLCSEVCATPAPLQPFYAATSQGRQVP